MNNNNIERIYRLTPMQEGMLYHKLLNEESTSYFVQNVIKLTGKVDVNLVKMSLELLLKKHPVLRTKIFYRKIKHPRQIVLKHEEIAVSEFDFSHMSGEEQELSLIQLKKQDVQRGFDLEKDVLMRVMLVKLSASDYKMVWSFHHIIMDGWCMSLVVKDFMDQYDALKNGTSLNDLMLEMERSSKRMAKYEEYIQWLSAQNVDKALQYWRDLLRDYTNDGNMDLGYPRPITVSDSQVNQVSIKLEEVVQEKLTSVALQLNVTENTIVEAAWGILLQRLTGENDAAFGKVVSGRNADIQGIEEIVGLFINTIPVRVQAEKGVTVKELIHQMQIQAVESGQYDYCSLPEIQALSSLKGRLIKSIIAFENYYAEDETKQFGGLSFEVESLIEQTNYPLSLIVFPEDTLRFEMMYNPNEYCQEEIEKMLASLKTIILEIIHTPNQLVTKIDAILDEDKDQLLYQFNNTKEGYPRDQTIHELFEAQVNSYPNREAVITANERVSYSTLNQRANELLRELKRNGVAQGSFVGIVTEKSVDMVAGMLAVLKNGCTYVPINADDPVNRLRFIVEECQIETILCGDQHRETMEAAVQSNLVSLHGEYAEEGEGVQVSATDGAYVIFTSGSTGHPKGVHVEHRNVVRLVKSQHFVPLEGARILQTGALSFDASTFEIWGALLNGGMVCLMETSLVTRSNELRAVLESYQITTMWMTAQLFNNLVDSDLEVFAPLHYLIIGGERLSESHVRQFTARHETKLINGYGPTENTTFSLYHPIQKGDTRIPIGRPLQNSTAYILNGEELCGIGMPGELCVGGDGVARGYLNHPELTMEKFVSHPYLKGERIYRTGDLARWLPDGTIEYLGRIDDQVKIRGFRIELGEIESVIKMQEGIQDAAVVAKVDKGGDLALCAYVVDKGNKAFNLKREIRNKLPDYMIPAYVIEMDQLPVTRNGKLDKRALPEPMFTSTEEYVAPRNETEATLVRIYQEILGLERVGIADDFFEIGGHSLRATRVMNLIESQLGVRLPLPILFNHPTVEQLSEQIQLQEMQDTYQLIARAEEKDYYAMSSQQKRLFILNEIDEFGTVYNIPGVIEMAEEVDIEKIQTICEQLIERHEALRTSFHVIGGEPVQKMATAVQFEVEYEEIEQLETEQVKERLQDFVRPFDLAKAPLFRVNVIKGKGKSFLMFDLHHIISDGASMNIITKEFSDLYNGKALAGLELHYKDYSEWMNQKDLEAQKAYWVEQFRKEIPVLDLPVDFARPRKRSFKGATLPIVIDKEVKETIQTLCKQTKTTEYMVFLTAFMVLLQKYSGQEDLVVGSPISGRTHRDTEQMVGMFVNTLAMRGNPEKEKTFAAFLAEIKETTLKAYENQEYPFEDLVENVEVTRDLSRNPLFDCMLILQNQGKDDVVFKSTAIEKIEGNTTIAKFDLSLEIEFTQNGYIGNWEYCTDLFKEETIQRMAKQFNTLLAALQQVINEPLKKIDLLTADERELLVSQFNETKGMFPEEKTLHKLFEEQVNRTPEQIAVAFKDETLTYEVLNHKANSLARIIKNHVNKNEIVGLLIGKRTEMLVSIMAILKSGAAYLPIDPALPSDRIEYMLKDSSAKVLLTDHELANKVNSFYDGTIVDIDQVGHYTDDRSTDLQSEGNSEDLAYVIYTSGSTGKPKGVMVHHKALCNLIEGISSKIDFSAGKRILNLTTISFDIFFVETILPLVKGMSVIILDENEQKDSGFIRKAIEKYQINMLQTTPSRMKVLVENEKAFKRSFESLTEVMIGGEALSAELAATLLQTFPCPIYNMYGPTETTVWSTVQEIKPGAPITIGKPILNTKVLILNEDGMIQPIGAKGELCIAGAGVTKGYWNRPKLTAERFVKSSILEDELIYRTGDLARFLPDGNIEYIGRMDFQVKIRGFRIEPGEIEAEMKHQDGIQDVAVVAKADDTGERVLCAYYVDRNPDNENRVMQLKKGLSKALPEYMIPSYFVRLEKIPLNNSGKLDRNALPDQVITRTSAKVAPRNDTEEVLVRIFEEVLGISQVSIEDHFFQIGGHSLRATRVINLIEVRLGVRLPLIRIFDYPTVELLSEHIQNKKVEEGYQPIAKADEKEYYPVSSQQKRLYIINEMSDLGTVYNMPDAVELAGNVQYEKIDDICKVLVARHEALRTSFHVMKGEPIQRIAEMAEIHVEYEETEQINAKMLEKEWSTFVRPFDLAKAPLFRVKLIKGQDKSLLLFDMHHMISDGESMNILTKEFSELYNGNELAKKELHYKDYSEWFRQKDLQAQKDYWLEQFADEIPILELPTDYPRPSKQSFNGATLSVFVEKEVKEVIRDICQKTNTTEYMVLLSAFMVLLQKYSREEDIVVGSPISGRMHRDTEEMLGMFVNSLAMRGKPAGTKTYAQFLKEIKETTLTAYDHQEYPFEDLVENVNVPRDSSRHPIFDCMLALQNQEHRDAPLNNVSLQGVQTNSDVSKFDLTLNIDIRDEGYWFNWEYCTDLFEEATIKLMADRMNHLVNTIHEDMSQTIDEISLISEEEQSHLLYAFNNTKEVYPRNQTIHELFEDMVKLNPDREAVITANERVSYSTLNQRANELLGELKRNGVDQDSFVGIVTEKSVDMVAGMLAILKSGCSYVPIDADYPVNRLRYMVEECQIETILCGDQHRESIEAAVQANFLSLQGEFAEAETIIEAVKGSPNNGAYVIFTSGSTGQPKGVHVEHRNVVRLVKSQYFVPLEGARILQTGALSFDASTFEIWGALLNGGMVCLMETSLVTRTNELRAVLEAHQIDMMWMTAQLFNNLVDSDLEVFAPLRYLIIGGEKLSESHVRQFTACHETKLINGYGPTENTTFSLYHPIQKGETRIPIGRPLQNSTAYILNGEQLCGIGMPGELCVGGEGVARGYLNRPELTREKFVSHPYLKGERIYLTGDLARWLPNGTIEYLGRIDDQVKIRGFRIELGEIESVIKKQDGIQDAAVVAKEDRVGDLTLCAFVVYKDKEARNYTYELKKELRNELPDYMIPAYVIEMEQLPVTRNGKLDKRSLPEPVFTSWAEYVAPTNVTEEILVQVYQEVLGLEKVSVVDGFFEIGGDSIKAIRIISKMREHGYALDYETMFQEKTIRGISDRLKLVDSEMLKDDQNPVSGGVELTPIQHEFMKWKFKKPHHFNQAIMVYTDRELSNETVYSTLNELVIHHDMLRATFNNGKQIIRRADENNLVDLSVYNFKHLSWDELKKEIGSQCEIIQASINLENGPLLRSALFHTSQGTHVLLCIHHLIIDGVSWRILLEDFNTVYMQLQQNLQTKLPLKTVSYQKWSQALIEYGESYLVKREIPYWQKISQKLKELSDPLPIQIGEEPYSYDIELSEELTSQLLHEAGKAYNTEINELFLTALGTAFYRSFGLNKVAIELEGHGRYPLEKSVNIDRTVGWFTNTYPVIVEAQSDEIGSNIKHTKEMLRNVPNSGLEYGILKHLMKSEVNEEFNKRRLNISFNYLGNLHDSEGGIFQFSPFSPGNMSAKENSNGKLITIDGVIEKKVLRFTIQSMASGNDQQKIKVFCTHFESTLKDVIKHCMSVEENQYTLSDYGDEMEWDETDLEGVLELFVGDQNE